MTERKIDKQNMRLTKYIGLGIFYFKCNLRNFYLEEQFDSKLLRLFV